MSLLLYMAVLLVFARVIAWDTEWRKIDRKRSEAVVLDCDRFIFASLVLTLILHCFLSTLVCVIASVES